MDLRVSATTSRFLSMRLCGFALLAATAFLGSARPAAAQFGPAPSFAPAVPPTFALNTFPLTVSLVDLNHDNNLDLVVPVCSANGVTVSLGTGTGTFNTATLIPAGACSEAAVVTSLNGDADPDIAVVNFGAGGGAVGSVSIFFGNGTGGFTASAANPIVVGNEPFSIAVGNFNGDAFPDIVTANSFSNNISILLGTGVGTWGAPASVAAGTGPRSVVVGRLNNDAIDDIVVANFLDAGTANVNVLIGNGNGTFSAAVPYAAGSGARSVALADMNGDTRLDVVSANQVAGTVSVLLGNGDGTFGFATNTLVGNGPTGVLVGDFNLDGKLDVGSVNQNDGALKLLNGNGAGALDLAGATSLTVGALPSFAGAGDLTNDGKPDLVVTNSGAGNASIFLNTLTLTTDLGITVSAPASVVAGQTVAYTITVTNNGASLATGVSVADTTPAGLTFMSNTGACTTAFPCALGTINPGANKQFVATFTVAAGYAGANPLLNTATVSSTSTDPTPGNNSQTGSTTVTFSANLGITKTGAPATVVAGQNVVYTVVVSNAGPSNAAGVSVADTTPAGLTFVSNTGACTTAYPCAVGALAAAGSATITSTYTVSPDYAGAIPLLNTATVSAATTDPTPANNTATASNPVSYSANLAITKTGPANISAGQNIVYTITVTNNGPSRAATVSVADTTPTGLTFVSNTGACTTAFPCALGTMTSGDVKTITATYTIAAGYTGPNPLVNTATVSSATTDPTPANNTASASTTVAPSTDLAITKTGPATLSRGQNGVYTITVTNNGPGSATVVSVADPTPTGLTFVSNTGSCTTAYPCALGTLASGATRTITTTYTVPAAYAGPEPVVNTATVSATSFDPVSSNNSATVSTPLDSMRFNTVAPCRVLDTRDAAGPLGGPSLQAGAQRSFTLTGGACGVPTTAQAVSINITVTGPTDAGDLRLYPTGDALPDSSSINYSAGQTRANNAIITLGTGGSINVQCDQATGTVDFILDVNGYFAP